MRYYRLIPDFERCRSFYVNPFPDRDRIGNAMRTGERLLERWHQARVSLRCGSDSASASDFVQTDWTCAHFGVNAKAAEGLEPLIAGCAELLPFEYGGEQYYVLYVRTAPDCLNHQQTIFHGGADGSPLHIYAATFNPARLPHSPLFRVACGNDYFVTEDLKDHIERAKLTGVRFQFMWSDDGSEPDEPEYKPPKPKRRRKRPKKSPTPPAPRDLLLERLWHDVILPRGDRDSLERSLALARIDALSGVPPGRYDSARTLRRLVKCGVSKEELLQLLSGLAYEVVFETLVAIEEECLDVTPELESLHEDLLTAEPG